MLRRTLRTATVLIAGGLLLSSVLTSSAQAQSAPSEQTQGEQTSNDKAQGEVKSADQAKAEEESAKARAMAEYEEADTKLPRSAGAPECVWTGRRITSLLWRDDIDTANRYIGLYERFGCSQEHLKIAFRCVVQQGPIDPKAADRLASRVHGCWIAPKEPTQTSSQATTGATEENGTTPN
ncbi:MAG: hypothetical protein ACR2GC_00305 [Methyloceanibacter sp.]|uniref:hypothetical protein n=1 Tax=Methyloceanibacter sp. TaxID=1965321 RepID=UPI003D9B9903